MNFDLKDKEAFRDLCQDDDNVLGLNLYIHHLAQIGQINEPYINSQGVEDETPLLVALLTGNRGAVETLLEMGAKPDLMDVSNFSPLSFACTGEDPEMVRLLLKYGANPNIKSVAGGTPLIFAASNNTDSSLMIKYLIEYGADVNAQTNRGVNALMNACRHGQLKSAEVLLEAGAVYPSRMIDTINTKLAKYKTELLDLLHKYEHRMEKEVENNQAYER